MILDTADLYEIPFLTSDDTANVRIRSSLNDSTMRGFLYLVLKIT